MALSKKCSPFKCVHHSDIYVINVCCPWQRTRCWATLYRERSKTFPRLPASKAEVAIPDNLKLTDTGEEFLLLEDGINDSGWTSYPICPMTRGAPPLPNTSPVSGYRRFPPHRPVEPLRQRWSKNDQQSWGWHGRLKRQMQKAHPNIFEFIEFLKTEQSATEIKITNSNFKNSKHTFCQSLLCWSQCTLKSAGKSLIVVNSSNPKIRKRVMIL